MGIPVNSSAFQPAVLAFFALISSMSTGQVTTSTANQWMWVSGSDLLNQRGTYGSQGVAAPGNTPGARVRSASWIDSSGNLWLFGGYGVPSTGPAHQGDLNDLWEFSAGAWTWVAGSDLADQPASYGTRRIPSATNLPGPRYQSVTWTDSAGNFWLFGGLGLDSISARGYLNDLWRLTNGKWTWMSGADVCCRAGKYGTRSKPSASTVPGARVSSSSWSDSSGNLWLFGGVGYDSGGNLGILNDLWKYSAGNWTWMSGSRTVNAFGVYGNQGIPSSKNVPGARSSAMTWVDSAGNLWLFGGQGNDQNGALCNQSGGPCELNDLWEYSSGEWTWMGGSSTVEQPGIYGTFGMPTAENVPGARQGGLTWTASDGSFWLFGGFGFDSTPEPNPVFGDLNDLWRFDGGQWTWVGGPDLAGQSGNYGTEGTPDPSNIPGARDSAAAWIDKSGNLWLFGGSDYWVPGGGKFNDLWQYQP
jgi:hypothetical protein